MQKAGVATSKTRIFSIINLGDILLFYDCWKSFIQGGVIYWNFGLWLWWNTVPWFALNIVRHEEVLLFILSEEWSAFFLLAAVSINFVLHHVTQFSVTAPERICRSGSQPLKNHNSD